MDSDHTQTRQNRGPSGLAGALLLSAACLIGGCAPSIARSGAALPAYLDLTAGKKVVAEARALLGTPYRYGGTTPRGFDCSGLVYYTHRKAGLTAPRSTAEQLRHARPVQLTELRPGDLLFFRLSRSKISHVGIYQGESIFIHAPSSGKRVSTGSLKNPFWKKRLVTAGRLH
jgi:cell wall-associated NlpC family hydrolase